MFSNVLNLENLGSKAAAAAWPPSVVAPTPEEAPPAVGASLSSIISKKRSSSAASASSAASSAIVRFRLFGAGGAQLCIGCRKASITAIDSSKSVAGWRYSGISVEIKQSLSKVCTLLASTIVRCRLLAEPLTDDIAEGSEENELEG